MLWIWITALSKTIFFLFQLSLKQHGMKKLLESEVSVNRV